MESFIIHGPTIIDHRSAWSNGYIYVKQGKIADVGQDLTSKQFKGVERYHLDESSFLLPGFIDLHIHGGYGVDVMDGTDEVYARLGKRLPEEGTTSYVATTITSSVEQTSRALHKAATHKEENGAATMLGVHLEGPFLSESKRGAQPIVHLQLPSVPQYETFQRFAQGKIKIVTLAPELAGATELQKQLQKEGVRTSIGHSNATYDDVLTFLEQEECDANVTHLFNGMSGFHHREPGVVGTALSHDRLLSELIVDGHHVHEGAIRGAYRAIGAKQLILITDAMRAKGLGDGSYELGGQRVIVSNGQARLEDGTLAGSVLKMNDAVDKMRSITGQRGKRLYE
ncbi:N-acetylglucosamine-6-phosphate deacetylase [Geomicrobium sp. JCM 19055]|uniref:N-acetylglucosamine-6-phosphate deacetylase n=1 Tax=Geomicrobium sp. JCM 19055 TaxID=1460649 RepID=UPI00045ED82A|nr:N-acetylglucosamine-6-phosphate deacetylase [Geomicrobium sp. JCM 19055]GAJ98882.1 N-acetylglucosamine-6-phosphate deacetylase [Geomicrobium sp. JCM 19055]